MFFFANGVQICSPRMHFDPGSPTCIFLHHLQANFFLQRTICLNIWCVGALWTSPLSKFTGGSRWNSLPLATCGCTFSSSRNARVKTNFFTTWLPEKKNMHLGWVKPTPSKISANSSCLILVLPHIVADRFLLFVFVTSHRPYLWFWWVREDCSKVQVFYRRQWQAVGVWSRIALFALGFEEIAKVGETMDVQD